MSKSNVHFHLILELTHFLLLLLIIILSQTNFVKAARPGLKSSGSRPGCIEVERQALLKIKVNLVDPSGRLSSWLGKKCCRWEGITCSNRTGNVVKVDLGTDHDTSSDLLSGKLDPSLLVLNQLNYLNLSSNSFEGTIPSFIGNLSNLQYLDLSNSGFSVSDLSWLSSLTSVRYLNLENVDLSLESSSWLKAISILPSLSELHMQGCKLENPFPSISVANLTRLSVIDLSDNQLITEVLPWLFNITTLVDIDLSSCNITGRVSQSPWHNLHNLEILDLGLNSIRDDIGTLIRALAERSNSSLGSLSLEDNHFNGPLGESLGLLTSLTSLVLTGNSISGKIPSSIGRLSFLEELYLASNIMNGSIPESIGRLSSLHTFDISDNEISGSIPLSFGELFSLSNLDISYNKMNGYIPESFGELSSLVVMDLSDNYWKGKLSELHFKKLKELKSLRIASSDGALVFGMTRNWIPPFSLETIYITGCLLGPAFPPWIKTQTELVYITLSNAQILDTIPNWFWNLTTSQVISFDLSHNEIGGVLPNFLQFNDLDEAVLSHNYFHGLIPVWSNVSTLYLGNNSFSGPIPKEIGTLMSTLSILDLSLNFLNGTIPMSIRKLENLESLDLSHNILSGRMFDKWDTLKILGYLDLSKNDLFGQIPTSICSSPYLFWLDLSDNSLNEALPLSFQNCTRLQALNLGENRLTGNISKWMGNNLVESLQVLKLQKNRLSGEIPPTICRFLNLHALDLSQNHLFGTIPACFNNLSRLTGSTSNAQVDLWDQEMDFVIKGREWTNYIKTLNILNIIDVSNNNLTGEIPDEIGNLIALGTLNFSRNKLSGKIPDKIGALKQLETLDLSHNHLSGQIPTSMVSLTSLNFLDLSFNNFSGAIPSSTQFSTFNNSIYEGNPKLCGAPLPNSCFTHASEDSDRDKDDKRKGAKRGEDDEMFWFYVSLGTGFLVGFGGLLVSLVIKRSWRIVFFRYFDGVNDKIFVFVAVNIARLKRTIKKEEN